MEQRFVKPWDYGQKVDRKDLIKIISEYSSLETIKHYKARGFIGKESWQLDIADEADGIFWKVLKYLEELLDDHTIVVDMEVERVLHCREDNQFIAWHALDILHCADGYKLTPTDLQHLKKFLKTPKGKELEGWAEWEAYWEKREAARAKKKK